GALTVGEFVSFIAALALFMDPIRKFSQANIRLSQAAAAGKRIFHLLQTPNEIDNGEHKPVQFEKSIEIKNLKFGYGEEDILKGVSFEILKGQKVALVGLSGSGKTTIINLLLGLYPVEKNQILIDGKDVNDIKLFNLRGLSGLVSQDIFLFNDSVRNNLCLGESFSDEQLNEALKVAYAYDFVQELEDGLDTVIGDRGMRLSGGQKQRITIARAFLHDAPILLFDEATSALDNESEKVVQKALESVAGDKTVIAVAHRLTTVQDYDKIYVMKQGKITEDGKHEDLLALNGEYAKLYELSGN
ncbi:MAG: ABC transporter ATP-binding protein, partial [Bacteriovoracaceae bacterium]